MSGGMKRENTSYGSDEWINVVIVAQSDDDYFNKISALFDLAIITHLSSLQEYDFRTTSCQSTMSR